MVLTDVQLLMVLVVHAVPDPRVIPVMMIPDDPLSMTVRHQTPISRLHSVPRDESPSPHSSNLRLHIKTN